MHFCNPKVRFHILFYFCYYPPLQSASIWPNSFSAAPCLEYQVLPSSVGAGFTAGATSMQWSDLIKVDWFLESTYLLDILIHSCEFQSFAFRPASPLFLAAIFQFNFIFFVFKTHLIRNCISVPLFFIHWDVWSLHIFTSFLYKVHTIRSSLLWAISNCLSISWSFRKDIYNSQVSPLYAQALIRIQSA
jgi:hypothetical protein